MNETLYLVLSSTKLSIMGEALPLPEGVEFLCPVFKSREKAQKLLDGVMGGHGTIVELERIKKAKDDQSPPPIKASRTKSKEHT